MIRKHLLQIVIIQAVVSVFFVHSYALEKESHKQINEYIARNNPNGFSLHSHLKDPLGFQKGVEEEFSSKAVWWWLGEGGKTEDEPFTRSANHFHNPLTDEGFSGLWGNGVFLAGDSALSWSQKDVGHQSQGGYYSWYDTRDYFYNALTGSTKTEREDYFAETFRGLGQLMHLVTDMSVPEHTRDDGHYLGILPFYEHYEKWVKKNVDISYFATITPVFFDPVSLDNANRLGDVPIANLFDTDQYVLGSDPGVTVNNNAIGLSEYTNANFLSPDTMFTEDFPYPSADDCVINVDNKRQYLKSVGHGEQVDHLAAVSRLFFWRTRHFSRVDESLPVGLDPLCYEEYASKLLPRAVGYSSDLLKYFFRGTLEITPPEEYVYSIIDGSETPQEFRYIKAKVKNTTPDEEIQDGTIMAVARYKKRTDYTPDLTNDPPCASSRESDFSYSVSTPADILFLSSGGEKEFVFDFSEDPIPAGITDLYLHVVFKGTLGNEQDIAVAVGMKDLNEPHHFNYLNCTDFYNIRGAPMLIGDLWKHLAEDWWGPNPEDLWGHIWENLTEQQEHLLDNVDITITTELSFAATDTDLSSSPVVATLEDLPYARYSRLIMLCEDLESYWLKHHVTERKNGELLFEEPQEPFEHEVYKSVVNQDNGGLWESAPVKSFRGQMFHSGFFFIHCERGLCNWHLLEDEDFFPLQDLEPYPATMHFP